MPRRALLATIITGAVGALMGVLLGGLVGRVIALFGDETVQTSVPMIFCATLGFFVGGASTIKGSLERFGAPRAPLATFVAAVVLVVLVGGVSVTAKSGVQVVLTALVAIVLASAAAVAIGKPAAAPIHGLNSPRTPRGKAPEPEGGTDPSAVQPRAAKAARRIGPARDTVNLEDWVSENGPSVEPSPQPISAHPEMARPRRDRPLSRADVAGPTAARSGIKKTAAPANKAATKKTATKETATKKTATKKTAAPAKKAAVKKAVVKKAAPATKKARGTAKKAR